MEDRQRPRIPGEAEVILSEERLKDLDFLIGEWVDEGGDSIVQTTVKMSADKSHLIRDFCVLQQGKELLTGTQTIAVDPAHGDREGLVVRLVRRLRRIDLDEERRRMANPRERRHFRWRRGGRDLHYQALSKDRIEPKTMHKVVGDSVEPDATSILVRKAPTPKNRIHEEVPQAEGIYFAFPLLIGAGLLICLLTNGEHSRRSERKGPVPAGTHPAPKAPVAGPARQPRGRDSDD